MARNGPNRVAFYARRSMDVVSQQEFTGVGARTRGEDAYEAAQSAKQPGQVVRMTCRRRFGVYTVTVYQRN